MNPWSNHMTSVPSMTWKLFEILSIHRIFSNVWLKREIRRFGDKDSPFCTVHHFWAVPFEGHCGCVWVVPRVVDFNNVVRDSSNWNILIKAHKLFPCHVQCLVLGPGLHFLFGFVWWHHCNFVQFQGSQASVCNRNCEGTTIPNMKKTGQGPKFLYDQAESDISPTDIPQTKYQHGFINLNRWCWPFNSLNFPATKKVRNTLLDGF